MDDILRILLIDDNPSDRVLILHELHRVFTSVQVQQIIDREGFMHALEQGDFDLVITDYHLHWSDGLTILRTVKERWPNCPVIMCTDTGNEEIAVESMKAGLDDYVLKSPTHFKRLIVAVQEALEQAKQRQALREIEEEEQLRARIYEEIVQHRPGEALKKILPLLSEFLPVDSSGLLIWSPGKAGFQGHKQWVRLEAEESCRAMFRDLYGQE